MTFLIFMGDCLQLGLVYRADSPQAVRKLRSALSDPNKVPDISHCVPPAQCRLLVAPVTGRRFHDPRSVTSSESLHLQHCETDSGLGSASFDSHSTSSAGSTNSPPHLKRHASGPCGSHYVRRFPNKCSFHICVRYMKSY
ncbi:rap guanine nucleotide exchange factor 6 [Caerostris extrusa]|uniref:Rap guanine nucleotide exchange factor 6 n=1 Tax=Caerostris extrusa TaxID=172846 RepID=A0AAV4VJI3_CAEEX|nr:rap guanine nucleotide exchange factor 6 [Caerostris extrusa]